MSQVFVTDRQTDGRMSFNDPRFHERRGQLCNDLTCSHNNIQFSFLYLDHINMYNVYLMLVLT